jgi:hypothetical protein
METSVKPEEKLETSPSTTLNVQEEQEVETKTPKEQLEEIQETDEDIYKRAKAEEMDLISKYKKDNLHPEEEQPALIMKDEYGQDVPHLLINDKYIPKVQADVMIQEKKIIIEYQKLEAMKEELKRYRKLGKEVLKINNKKNG